jgi:hypothetical protein
VVVETAEDGSDEVVEVDGIGRRVREGFDGSTVVVGVSVEVDVVDGDPESVVEVEVDVVEEVEVDVVEEVDEVEVVSGPVE